MTMHQPPGPARLSGRPPENIDDLLRAFLRAEMPAPWPILRPPQQSPAKPSVKLPIKAPRRWPVLGSRFALAATMAFCLVGSLALTSLFPGGVPQAGDAKSSDTTANSLPRTTFETKTPDGRTVTGTEQSRGNKITITIKFADPQPMDD